MKNLAYLLAAALVLFSAWAFLYWTKVESVTLVSRSWHTELYIEDFQERHLGDWWQYVPNDAYNRNAYSKKRGEDCQTVAKVRTCTARYDTWVDYTVKRWGYFTTIANDGTLDNRITIPEPSIQCANIEEIGCQRYSGNQTRRIATFQRGNNTFTCDYDKDTWEAFTDGNDYKMLFGVVRNEPRCGLVP